MYPPGVTFSIKTSLAAIFFIFIIYNPDRLLYDMIAMLDTGTGSRHGCRCSDTQIKNGKRLIRITFADAPVA
jgi:hypothetical protein